MECFLKLSGFSVMIADASAASGRSLGFGHCEVVILDEYAVEQMGGSLDTIDTLVRDLLGVEVITVVAIMTYSSRDWCIRSRRESNRLLCFDPFELEAIVETIGRKHSGCEYIADKICNEDTVVNRRPPAKRQVVKRISR